MLLYIYIQTVTKHLRLTLCLSFGTKLFQRCMNQSFETGISKVPLNFDQTGRIHRNINYQVIRYPLVIGIISIKERKSF